MSIERSASNIESRTAVASSKFEAHRAEREAAVPGRPLPQHPSLLYGAALWRLGLLFSRFLPEHGLKNFGDAASMGYARCCPRRREVIIENLAPVLGSRAAAERMAPRLFQQFARKLVDIWRFEAGLPMDNIFAELTGWDYFLAAQKSGRGVLLVTPHLGNWEFGAPLLAQHGFKLNVITLAEPGHGLTELRQAARARWGIETLVIGRDPFAFVEIIRRLEAGATVALLIDRPPKTSAVEVELFGEKFSASIAAAELARATNCEILPVYLPRIGERYAAHVLPPVPYERTTLRDRGLRRQLTQRILSALEPAIRQYADQWYHFVPVWMR